MSDWLSRKAGFGGHRRPVPAPSSQRLQYLCAQSMLKSELKPIEFPYRS